MWQIWLDDPTGNRIALLDRIVSLSISMIANDIGAFQVALPADFDDSFIHLDGLLEFWRAPEGGSLRLVRVGMVRKWVYSEDESGNEILTIYGSDQIELLKRRIVAYPAGIAFATDTGPADDIIKGIVRSNLGATATDTTRDLTALNLTVAPDWGLGAAVARNFAWKNVLTICQAAADAGTQAGTDLYFDLVPVIVSPTQLGFELRTFTGQIGQDNSARVFFGKQWGNLGSPKLERDYSEEVNYAYVLGMSEEAATVSDTARIGASPWNRREVYVNASNESGAGLTSKGQATIQAGRPRLRFSGALLDTSQARYGIDWQFGDTVTVDYRGLQFSGMVRAVRLSLDEGGQETLECKVETDV